MSQNNQNSNKRYIGKVKTQNGQNGTFQKILINNPYANNQDGTPNTYFKGCLIWLDQETGKKYLVKQIGIGDYKQPKNGCGSFITISLDNEYEVQELK